MNHNIAIRRALTAALGLLLFVSAAASAQSQIYPAPPAVGGRYVIVVISDGYAANEWWKFDRAVNGLLLNGLMADPFYSGQGASFTIHKVFLPQTTVGQSNFGITPNYDVNRCYIDTEPGTPPTPTSPGTPGTTDKIEAAVQSLAPTRTVVIGNYEGVSMGCTEDTWTFVSAGAREVGGVLEHEFGHLIAGLYDEYALKGANDPYPGPAVDGPNCSNAFTGGLRTPVWAKVTTLPHPVTNPDGCLFYETGIYRPYDTCRMRSPDAAFCDVCAGAMSDVLKPLASSILARINMTAPVLAAGFFQQPQARPVVPPGTARLAPSIRLMVEIAKPLADSSFGAKARVTSSASMTSPVVQSYRRVGDYVYGIVEGPDTVLEVVVLPGDPFQRRAYGGVSAPHRASDDPITARPVLTSRVAVMLPGLTRAAIMTRPIHVLFYRLDSSTAHQADGTPASVTPAAFGALIAVHWPVLVDIATDDLRKAVSSLP